MEFTSPIDTEATDEYGWKIIPEDIKESMKKYYFELELQREAVYPQMEVSVSKKHSA